MPETTRPGADDAAVSQELARMTATRGQPQPSPAEELAFLAGLNGTSRLPPDLRVGILALTDQAPLEHPELTELLRLLEESARLTMAAAQRTLPLWGKPGTSDRLQLRALENAIARAGTRVLLDHAARFPPLPPAVPDEDAALSAAHAAAMVLRPITQDRHPGAWTAQVRAIDLVDTELRHYAATGEPPPWFSPAEMTVSRDGARRGHSPANPGAMPLHDHEELTRWTARRIELFLSPQDPQPAGSLAMDTEPLLLGDLLLSPLVDWDLAGHRGPAQRKISGHEHIPQELAVTSGPTPHDHASLSYRVLLQPRLTHRQIQEKLAAGDAAAVATHILECAQTMPPLAQACREAAIRLPEDHLQVRHRIPGYAPPLQWHLTPEENMEALLRITCGLQNPAALREKAEACYAALVLRHLESELLARADRFAAGNRMSPQDRERERRTQIRSATTSLFGAQLLAHHPPPGHQPHSPGVLLLSEGMTALHHAARAIQRLESDLRNEGIITLDEEDMEHLRRQATPHLANRLAHADFAITAGERLLLQQASHSPETRSMPASRRTSRKPGTGRKRGTHTAGQSRRE